LRGYGQRCTFVRECRRTHARNFRHGRCRRARRARSACADQRGQPAASAARRPGTRSSAARAFTSGADLRHACGGVPGRGE
jgi:hypothetical protein